jgi:hypothetical protein
VLERLENAAPDTDGEPAAILVVEEIPSAASRPPLA